MAYTPRTPILSPSQPDTFVSVPDASSASPIYRTSSLEQSPNLSPGTRKLSARLFGSQGAQLGLNLDLDAPTFDEYGSYRSQLSAVSTSSSKDECGPITPVYMSPGPEDYTLGKTQKVVLDSRESATSSEGEPWLTGVEQHTPDVKLRTENLS